MGVVGAPVQAASADLGRSAGKFVPHSKETAMRGVAPYVGVFVLCAVLAAALAHGQEPGKRGLSELEQYKELKKLKDEEKKLRQEEIRKDSAKLMKLFPRGVAVVVFLKKMGKDTKDSEIKGWIVGVEEVLGEKFIRVDKPGPYSPKLTIALIKGDSIVAIIRASERK